ncbi:MAG: AsmA-like C-terminal region-containing protein [Muribaculaceae bacterium]|nr:AsmA-like C-terminal region-containing protein [Muribaculaceae bacterium]
MNPDFPSEKQSAEKLGTAAPQSSTRRKRRRGRVVLWCVGGLVVAVVGALTCLTLLLTPDRLSEIVRREASEYLNADVKVSNLRFTLWSTFPRLCLQADSVSVVSRSLDSIPAELRASLPENASFLGSAGAFKGGVNLLRLLSGRIRLHDVEVRNLHINLVAVNDSIANYLILPPDNTSDNGIPEVSANEIRISGPGSLSYFSVSSGLDADMLIKGMTLKERHGNGARAGGYRLTASGRLSIVSGTVTLLSGFPFGLDGNVNVSYKPFDLTLSDFGINLADLRSSMNMNLNAGSSVNVDDFSYNIASFHLMRLLEYLPAAWLPDMEGVTGDMTVNVSARLLSPFNISSGTLPDFTVMVDVPDGEIGYRAAGIPPVNLRHVGLRANLVFNGAQPDSTYVDVPRFTLEGDGMSLSVEGRLTDILSGSPHVRASLVVAGDLGKVAALVPQLGDMKTKGTLSMLADMSFTMPGNSSGITDMDIALSGNVLKPSVSTGTLRTTADSLAFRLGSQAAVASPEALREGVTEFGMSVEGFRLSDGNFMVTSRSLALSSSGRDSLNIKAGSAAARVMLRGVTLATPHTDLALNDLDLSCSLRKDARPAPAPDARFALAAQPDSRWLRECRHSPLWVPSPLSASLREYLTRHDVTVGLSTSGGHMKIHGYGPVFDFMPTALTLCNDSAVIHRFGFRSGGSEMKLRGRISDMRPWLLSATPQTLMASLEMDVDTLDINSLARALALASGEKHRKAPGKERVRTGKDSTAKGESTFIIPRNILADIHISGDEVIYTNLNLTGLSSDIHAAGGNVDIPSLRLNASFGGASVGVGYHTADIEKIGLSLTGALTDIDLTRFFNKFESLPRRWPSLLNLSGRVSMDVGLDMHVFPDMEIEMASLDGAVNVSASDLVLKQNHFIHHIASMMLIHSHDPIHIADINLHATVHDNLLEVYPFTFRFNDYRLVGEGVNNFAGELDYHIGVMHSPVPIKFGIDIKGMFHHPQVRFGRAGWDSRDAMRVTGKISKSFDVNLVRNATVLGNKFMHEGAVYPENR